MNKFLAVAESLFELKLNAIHNSIDFHWQFNGWADKYGKSSEKFEPELTYTKQDVKELVELIKVDYNLGMWLDSKEGLYNPQMTETYERFLIKRLESNLASMVKLGTQTEMFA